MKIPQEYDFLLKLIFVSCVTAIFVHVSILVPWTYKQEIQDQNRIINELQAENQYLNNLNDHVSAIYNNLYIENTELLDQINYINSLLRDSDSLYYSHMRSFMLLVNIIDGEAGEIATHEERLCVGHAALNRCNNEFNSLYQCLTEQGRHQFRPRFFNRFTIPRTTSSYWAAYLLLTGNGLSECSSVTHFFSPRSMPRGTPQIYSIELIKQGIHPEQETVVAHYRDPSAFCRSPHPTMGCIYSFSRRHGFQYFFSVSGEQRTYGSLIDVHIPNFAKSNLYSCHSNLHRNIRPEYFVFCERNQ